MTAVSCVVPALADLDLLAAHLPPLLDELAAADGEVVLVDDTGTGFLAGWCEPRFPGVRVVAREHNGGFARALADGVAAARGALVFAMNPDLRVRTGFLGPLVEALSDPAVFAATPRVLLPDGGVESAAPLELRAGLWRLAAPPAASDVPVDPVEVPVPFALGGAMLARRDELLAAGFDALFEPFYVEDVDLAWRAWGEGRRVVLRNDSVVEHRNRGTIARHVPAALVRATIERNWLLFQWKHLDGAELEEHLRTLRARATEALVLGRREELEWFALALESAGEALAGRAESPATPFRDLLRTAGGGAARPRP